jgi:hypothetical protein
LAKKGQFASYKEKLEKWTEFHYYTDGAGIINFNKKYLKKNLFRGRAPPGK